MKKTLVKKNKLYKLGLMGLAFGAMSAPIALAASCGDESSASIGQNWVFDSHRTVQWVQPNGTGKTDITDIFGYMPANAGNFFSNTVSEKELRSTMSLPFIRRVRVQPDVTNYDPVTKKTKSIETSTVYREPKLRFNAIKAIILIDEKDKQHVFDRDHSDDNDLLSSDPRDINSKLFKDTLSSTEQDKRIKAIKFDFIDGLSDHKWRQNLTGDAGDEVTADDFYLGFVHSLFAISKDTLSYSGLTFNLSVKDNETQTGNFRRTFDLITNAANTNTEPQPYKTPTQTTSSGPVVLNSYSSFLGLDISPFTNFSNKNKAIVDSANGGKSFILNFKADASVYFKKVFWDRFADENMFTAIPSKKILAMVNTYADKMKSVVTAPAGTTGDNLSKYLNATEYASFQNSLVYKSGYWHMILAQPKDFYTAGAYYLASNDSNTVRLKINEDFVDQRWVKQTNSANARTTVDTFIIKYTTSASAKTLSYKEGTSVIGDFGQLESSAQNAASSQEENYGLTRTKDFMATGLPLYQDYMKLSFMPVFGEGYSHTAHYFNDNFSKVMYGYTNREMDDQTSTYRNNYVEYLATGDGYKFRKLMAALQNVYTVARERTVDGAYKPSTFIDWTVVYPPEQKIGGIDSNPAQPFNLSEVYKSNPTSPDLVKVANDVLSKFVAVDSAQGFNVAPITHQTYVDQFLKGQGDAKYGPSAQASVAELGNKTPYEYIKVQMRALLDRVLKKPLPANPADVTEDQLLVFEMPYGIKSQDEFRITKEEQESLNAYKRMLRDIDPRLKVVAAMKPTSVDKNGVFQDATIAKSATGLVFDEWPNNETQFVVSSTSEDKTPTKENIHNTDRTPSEQEGSLVGYGWAALPGAHRVIARDSPAYSMMQGLGYMQKGTIFLLSYFADPANESKWINNEYLKPLKDFLTFLRTDFDRHVEAATLINTGLTSSRKDDILTMFKKIRFNGLWKTNPYDVAHYDYLAFTGWEEMLTLYKDTKKFIDAKTATPDQQAIFNDIESAAYGYLDTWMNYLVASGVEQYFNTISVEKVLKIMTAFGAINTDSYRPAVQVIVDRDIYTPSLQKTWFYHIGYDSLWPYSSLTRRFVDLDFKNNFFKDTPLFKDKDGTYKTPTEGGIAY